MNNFSNLNLVFFEKLDSLVWDSSLHQMGYNSPYHSYNDIMFHLSTNKNKNLSCIFFYNKIPLILLPLSIYKKNLIFPVKPCPIFLINKKYNNKFLVNFTINYVKKILTKYKKKNYIFSDHPFTKYPTDKKNYKI